MQKLAEICVRRPVFATMLILSLVVLGIASYRELGVDLFPKVEFPTVVVSVTLEGAGPEEMETQVTKPIEEALNTISGLDELRSISSEGLSLTFATFVLERDIDSAAQDVRDKVSRVMNQLPLGIDPPVIEKADPDATPIMIIAVSGNRSLREITKIAQDRIKEPLESIAGVGSIEVLGGREREIQIYVDPEKLRAYGLTLDQVRSAVRAQNVEVPGGRIDLTDRELVLRTMGRLPRVSDFQHLIVAYKNDSAIKLSDIGRIEDGVLEPRSISRLDGRNAVSLLVRKQSGTNTVEVADLVEANLAELTAGIPAGMTAELVRDASLFIRRSVEELMFHMMLGGLLASLVVLLFMRNWRSALIAAVSIPTSLIATFTLMRIMDFTINNMTLLGLTLAVGIVIDDAIVVLENIFRHVEEENEEPKSAAITATREIGLAVTATTMSLVVIFLPVGFMSGIIGRFFSSYGLTMAFAILVSLLVAFTLTPMMCSILIRRHSRGATSRETLLFRGLDRSYGALLNWSMRHRLAIVGLSLLIVLSTIPLAMWVGKAVIPSDDTSDFEVTLKLSPGVNLDGASAQVNEIEQQLAKLPGVVHVLASVGDPLGGSVNQANIYVRLMDMGARELSQFEIMAEARKIMDQFPQIRSSVQVAGAIAIRGNTWNIPVNFSIRGPDLAALEKLSAQITSGMRAIPGFEDVDTSLESGKPELRVHISREKAAALGVRVDDVARSLRTYIAGERLGKFKELDEQYDIRLRGDQDFRSNINRVPHLMIPSQNGGQVELLSVAGLSRETGPVQIERLNRQRNVSIYSNLQPSKPLGEALADVQRIAGSLDIPPEYSLAFSGQAETMQEAMENFAVAIILSIIFMYMILASQFNSFIHPVTIMLSLPIAVPFALFSLLIAGETLNIYSALGLLVLFGIVKKNAILQVDYANTLRSRGLPLREAVVTASHTRLRPILMTTISFVAGLIPILFATGPGSASRRSIAVVAIGGQLLCLLITLLLTPVAYTLFEDLKRKILEWRAAPGALRSPSLAERSE
ncbi:MAG: efflux RND transporter permease subunit [Acidobacteriota bacterium]